jgi:hypothetical protein
MLAGLFLPPWRRPGGFFRAKRNGGVSPGQQKLWRSSCVKRYRFAGCGRGSHCRLRAFRLGQSTLIRLINQLETLTSGEILVDGKPTSQLKRRELRHLRRQVGFVFQQFNLYAHLNALENITLA